MRDNSIVLYGSGCSTTHYRKNLPTLVAGGANLGLQHGAYWRDGETRMSNVFLSILYSLGVQGVRRGWRDDLPSGRRR